VTCSLATSEGAAGASRSSATGTPAVSAATARSAQRCATGCGAVFAITPLPPRGLPYPGAPDDIRARFVQWPVNAPDTRPPRVEAIPNRRNLSGTATPNPHGYVGQVCQECRKCSWRAYLGACLGMSPYAATESFAGPGTGVVTLDRDYASLSDRTSHELIGWIVAPPVVSLGGRNSARPVQNFTYSSAPLR
jgi:hypothetical protein